MSFLASLAIFFIKMYARACVYEKKIVSLQPKWALCPELNGMKEILIVIGMVMAAVLLLSVGVILRKDHRFRSEHISENRRMRQAGIHCATSQDREARRRRKMKIDN